MLLAVAPCCGATLQPAQVHWYAFRLSMRLCMFPHQAAGGRQLPTFCIPGRLSSAQMGAVLAPLQQERVLHFADAHKAWGGFDRSRVGFRV